MADTITDAPAETEEQATGTEGEAPGGPESTIPPEVQRALKKANKEAETLRLKLKEFEDKEKTEAEKVAERLTAAEERAAKAERDLLRHRVAVAKGLPSELADRLQGDDEEAMSEDAERLLVVVKPKLPGSGSFDGGAREKSAPEGGDMNQLLRRAAGRA